MMNTLYDNITSDDSVKQVELKDYSRIIELLISIVDKLDNINNKLSNINFRPTTYPKHTIPSYRCVYCGQLVPENSIHACTPKWTCE